MTTFNHEELVVAVRERLKGIGKSFPDEDFIGDCVTHAWYALEHGGSGSLEEAARRGISAAAGDKPLESGDSWASVRPSDGKMLLQLADGHEPDTLVEHWHPNALVQDEEEARDVAALVDVAALPQGVRLFAKCLADGLDNAAIALALGFDPSLALSTVRVKLWRRRRTLRKYLAKQVGWAAKGRSPQYR